MNDEGYMSLQEWSRLNAAVIALRDGRQGVLLATSGTSEPQLLEVYPVTEAPVVGQPASQTALEPVRPRRNLLW